MIGLDINEFKNNLFKHFKIPTDLVRFNNGIWKSDDEENWYNIAGQFNQTQMQIFNAMCIIEDLYKSTQNK